MSSTLTPQSSRKRYRIPRSISEQESLINNENCPLARRDTPLPNDIRNLMELQSRGIFDDRDVSNLFDAIHRTQRAIDCVQRSRYSLHSSDPSKLSRLRRSSIKATHVHKIEENATRSSVTCLQRKRSGSVIPSKSDTGQSSEPSTIQVKATIIRSLEQAKEDIAQMNNDNVDEVRTHIAEVLDDALTALTAGRRALPHDAQLNLSHHLNQAQLTSRAMDPHSLDETKEIISRHLDEAMSTIVPPRQKTPSKIPSRRRTLARQIIKYSEENPLEDIFSGTAVDGKETAPEVPVTRSKSWTGPEAIVEVVRNVDGAKQAAAETKPDDLGAKKKIIAEKLKKAIQAIGYVATSMEPEPKADVKYNLMQADLVVSAMNEENFQKKRDKLIDLLNKIMDVMKTVPKPTIVDAETSKLAELRAKTAIVRSIGKIKEEIPSVTIENVLKKKNGIEKSLRETLVLLCKVGSRLGDTVSKDVKFHLMQAEILASALCASNLSQKKAKITDFLDQALQAILLTKSEEKDEDSSRKRGGGSQDLIEEFTPMECNDIPCTSRQAAKKNTMQLPFGAKLFLQHIDRINLLIVNLNGSNVNLTKRQMKLEIKQAMEALQTSVSSIAEETKEDVEQQLKHVSLLVSNLSLCNLNAVMKKLPEQLDLTKAALSSSKPQECRLHADSIPQRAIEYHKSEESPEPHAKATIVRCMDRIKTSLPEGTTGNLGIIKEGISSNVVEATEALNAINTALPADAKETIAGLLGDIKATNSAMHTHNFCENRTNILENVGKIMATIFPNAHAAQRSESRGKNLARQIIEYTDKNPLDELRETKQSPGNNAIQKYPLAKISHPDFEGRQKQVEEAINSIKGDCPNCDLLIFISPIKSQDTKCKKNQNIQVNAVNRQTGEVLGHFSMPEQKYKSLAEEGALAKYFTVRITREIQNFQNELHQVLQYINQTPHAQKFACKPETSTAIETHKSPAAVRRSIVVGRSEERFPKAIESSKSIPAQQPSVEPTIAELLELIAAEASIRDIDRFFDLADTQGFLIYAHPDFRDERSMYICEVYASTNQYLGTTKIRGEDILMELQNHPGVIKNFEVVVDVVDFMLPMKMRNTLVNIFDRMGLISLYDRLGSLVFNIYKKCGLRG